MKIDIKQPKYIIPLLALPFLCLFFYVYHADSTDAKPPISKPQNQLNANMGDVSDDIKKKALTDKLDAYRDMYKEADGLTAVSPVPVDQHLDSINQAMKRHFSVSPKDEAMAAAINHLRQTAPPVLKEKDPMDIFKQQMAYVDSMTKSRDSTKKPKAKLQAIQPKALTVYKLSDSVPGFNTVKPEIHPGFITAVIDENLTGFAGSRIRLRLLESIVAGTTTVPQGTYVYALISSFSEQRVTLTIKSILYYGQILPVKLELYDMDGLPGLFVPSSAFRDFTKDAGTNSVQGIDIESGSTSFLMSTADKLFQSTSSAIASIIRKDKAKLKYNTYIYLINNTQ